MALALFDLDNTLIGGDSDFFWGQFVGEQGLVDRESYLAQNQQYYEDYLTGSLNIKDYLHFVLGPLAGRSVADLLPLRKDYIAKYITPILLPKARALIEKHRQQGDELLIITATNSFITRPIADCYGIENLIAPEPEIVDGCFTGDYVGTPSFREGKITRLQEWLQDRHHTLAGSYFYSDSSNDLPLLELVDHPIVVDADDALEKISRERHWQSISLRG